MPPTQRSPHDLLPMTTEGLSWLHRVQSATNLLQGHLLYVVSQLSSLGVLGAAQRQKFGGEEGWDPIRAPADRSLLHVSTAVPAQGKQQNCREHISPENKRPLPPLINLRYIRG